MLVACVGGIVTAEITSICHNFGDELFVFALRGSALEFELDLDVDGAANTTVRDGPVSFKKGSCPT